MQKRSKLPDGMHDQHSLFIQGMLAHSLNGYLLRNRTGITLTFWRDPHILFSGTLF